MLPANLAKTRATGRGTYGELVVLSGSGAAGQVPAAVGTNSHFAGLSSAPASGSSATTLRYSPYPVPSALVGHHQHHHHNQQQAAQQQQNQAVFAAAAAAAATNHLLPFATSSTTSPAHILQYAAAAHSATNPFLEAAAAAMSYKRLLAAATVASLRPHLHIHPHLHQSSRAPPTPQLTYPLGDLLNVPSLDMSSLYSSAAAATLGM